MTARKADRSLQFESLEVRVNLTAATPANVSFGETIAAEVVHLESNSDQQLLRFIASLHSSAMVSDLPTQQQADTADRWLEDTTPGHPKRR